VETVEVFQRLGLALAIGLLIGIERGWRERDKEDGRRTAGIRTYALIGLLGGLAGTLVPLAGPWPLALIGLAFGLVFGVFQWRETQAHAQFSVTSFIVGVLVYMLGAYASLGDITAAGGAAIAMLAVLASRSVLHEFVRRLTWPELRSAVILLAMSFLFLPMLPNEAVDPWQVLNPFKLWLMVVLIAAVSFMGYGAVRILGERRGLLYAAAAGALVSSTAVTLNYARIAAKSQNTGGFAAAICIAWLISVVRMTAVAVAVQPALFLTLAVPIGAAAGIFALAAFVYFKSGKQSAGAKSAVLSSPFNLVEVFGLGALVVAVILAAKYLEDVFGEAGLVPFAAISGALDVDPITLTAANMAGDSAKLHLATEIILVAGASNLMLKTAVAVVIGGWRFGMKLVVASVAVLAAGGAIFLLS